MTATQDPYSRVYWRMVDDERFATIYPDDASLAAWLRLLLLADSSWPASAPLPFGIKKAALAKLTASGLVEVLPIGRFRLHGLDAERSKRSEQATSAINTRWIRPKDLADTPVIRSYPVSSSQRIPSLAELRQAEQSRDTEEVTPTTTSHRPSSDPSNEPRLSADQLAAWADFGSEWGPFKAAWLGRGFLWPPSGEKRAMLFEVVDSRPTAIGGWIAEAKGKSPREVIAHVLNRWHGIREGLLHDPDRPNRSSRSTGMSAIGAVIPSVVGKP